MLGVKPFQQLLLEGKDNEEIVRTCQALLEFEAKFVDATSQPAWLGIKGAALATLGSAYVNRVHGDRAENLERALQASERALLVYGRSTHPVEWGIIQNNLATAYTNRIRGIRADNLEKAIAACEASLTVRSRKGYPLEWAETQINLGIALTDRIGGEAAGNIERAIEAYRAALTVYSFAEYAHAWATTQNNLGNAYQRRILGQKPENLELAIQAYQAALTVRTPDGGRAAWATTQHNLALAYRNRVAGQRADNLEKAIKAFESALSVFTREDYPQDYAMALSNLANAYCDRIRGQRADNIERAIKACDDALAVYTPDAFPEHWAGTQNNLANAYQSRVRGNASDNLEMALSAYMAAVGYFTFEAFPQDWAMIQNNLAATYRHRIVGNRAENLGSAIRAYEAALTVRTRTAAPIEWARTQHNLGVALVESGRVGNLDQLHRGIEAREAALTVLSSDAFPRDHLRLARLLAQIGLEAGSWSRSQEACASAQAAFLFLFGQELEEEDAEDLISEAGALFATAAYAATELGELESAFVQLMHGKAQLLGVSLHRLTLQLSSEDRARFNELRDEIRGRARRVETIKGEDGAKELDALIALRREMAVLMERGGAKGRTDEQSLAIARKIAGASGAIVAPIVTPVGCKVLVFAIGDQGPAVTAIALPELTSGNFDEFLRGAPQVAELGGWLGAYTNNYEMDALIREIRSLERETPEYRAKVHRYNELMEHWLAAIAGLGPQLWRMLGQAIGSELRRRGLRPGARVIWMPSGAIGILPIGLAEDPQTSVRLGETFEITFAPSLEAMASATERLAAQSNARLGAIMPDAGLPATQFETSVIATHFHLTERTVLSGADVTLQRTLQALREGTYWHFATHGVFDWADVRRSSLQLSGGDRLTVGTLLDADDLARPRLVSLSACETGLYDFRRNADEFIGLPGTFMGLGAVGVLSTLWPVDDLATAFLVARFYDLHLAGGEAPPSALRHAQAWLSRATENDLIGYAEAMLAKPGFEAAPIVRIVKSMLRHTMDDESRGAREKPFHEEVVLPVTRGLLGRILARMRNDKAERRPFEHPYYWAGFIYAGQ